MNEARRRIAAAAAVPAVLLIAAVTFAASFTEFLASPTPTPAAQNHFPKNKQNESPMAVNPLNASNAITGANDEIQEPNCTPATGGSSDCPFDPNTNITGVYVTTNGGSSWSQSILHWESAGFVSDGDPSVAFGPKPTGNGHFSYAGGARAYFGSLAHVPTSGPNQELLAVSYSNNGGTSWSSPVLATNRTNPVAFNDKIAVWADANSSSPYFGNVYVSWTLFTGNAGFPEPIMFSRSTDGGMHFERPRKLTPSYDNSRVGGREGSTIRTGPDGSVYVFWEDTVSFRSAILGARSTNGGVSFGRPFFVSFVSDLPFKLPGASFRTNSYPQVDIKPGTPNGTIYIVWADYTSGHSVVKLTKSTNSGVTWSIPINAADVAGRSAFYPAVAVSGSNVFIGFNAIDDKTAGTAPGAGVVAYDAYYVLSMNGGTSFGSPAKISASSSDPDAATANDLTEQFIGDYNGAAAGPDGSFWFSWTDTRYAAPCPAIDSWRAGTTSTKPNIDDSCPSSFGDSDIQVARVMP